jgi:hypothetical protein
VLWLQYLAEKMAEKKVKRSAPHDTKPLTDFAKRGKFVFLRLLDVLAHALR